ncbi:MAG: flagellar hook-length control protein FliK [Thermoleophilia bacterium]
MRGDDDPSARVVGRGREELSCSPSRPCPSRRLSRPRPAPPSWSRTGCSCASARRSSRAWSPRRPTAAAACSRSRARSCAPSCPPACSPGCACRSWSTAPTPAASSFGSAGRPRRATTRRSPPSSPRRSRSGATATCSGPRSRSRAGAAAAGGPCRHRRGRRGRERHGRRGGGATARLVLHSPTLGPIEIRLELVAGVLDARVLVEPGEAAALAAEAAPDLARALERAAPGAARVDVGARAATEARPRPPRSGGGIDAYA